jgi:hypothetical protein
VYVDDTQTDNEHKPLSSHTVCAVFHPCHEQGIVAEFISNLYENWDICTAIRNEREAQKNPEVDDRHILLFLNIGIDSQNLIFRV